MTINRRHLLAASALGLAASCAPKAKTPDIHADIKAAESLTRNGRNWPPGLRGITRP